jgi:hypothetical protein
MDTPLPQLSELIEQRLLLVHHLGDSLEVSRSALLSNDAEAIARGAAHQAELCRQWSQLEDQLQRQAATSHASSAGRFPEGAPEIEHLAQLEAEWAALGNRIRHLTRVHRSLLRHLQRSLDILMRVVESSATTYSPELGLLRAEVRAGE